MAHCSLSLQRQHRGPPRKPIGSALRGHFKHWSGKDALLLNFGIPLPFEAALCSIRTESATKTLPKPKRAQRRSCWRSATLTILLLTEISIFEPHGGHNCFCVCVKLPRKEKLRDTCVMSLHHVSVSEVKVTGTWGCVLVYGSTEVSYRVEPPLVLLGNWSKSTLYSSWNLTSFIIPMACLIIIIIIIIYLSVNDLSPGGSGSRKLRFPDYVSMTQNGGKVVSLTHRPHLPPGNTPGNHFC